MCKKLFILIALSCIPLAAIAQVTLREALQSVEANNITLQAQRYAAQAMSLEARMGNSLDGLSVGYENLWGKPQAEYGKAGEFTVSQAFDFPSVYAARSRVAGNLERQYMAGLNAVRQEILLEAQKTFFELQSAYRMQDMFDARLESGKRLSDLYKERYESGDVSLIEKNKMLHEYLLFREVAAGNRIKIAELEKKLTALNGGKPLVVRPGDEPLEALPSLSVILEDYREMYPALQTLRLRQQGAEYGVRLSRLQSLPKFELGYKHEFASAGDRFNGVTAGLSIPIFSNRHNVKRARAVHSAAQLESRAAELECAAQVEELYGKAILLREALTEYGGLNGDEYLRILDTALEEGEITVVEYFSEVYSYYDVFSAMLRLELEYRLAVAELNVIYL